MEFLEKGEGKDRWECRHLESRQSIRKVNHLTGGLAHNNWGWRSYLMLDR
jgi:hypothetical protein